MGNDTRWPRCSTYRSRKPYCFFVAAMKHRFLTGRRYRADGDFSRSYPYVYNLKMVQLGPSSLVV